MLILDNIVLPLPFIFYHRHPPEGGGITIFAITLKGMTGFRAEMKTRAQTHLNALSL